MRNTHDLTAYSTVIKAVLNANSKALSGLSISDLAKYIEIIDYTFRIGVNMRDLNVSQRFRSEEKLRRI